jgi:hypothetical protein
MEIFCSFPVYLQANAGMIDTLEYAMREVKVLTISPALNTLNYNFKEYVH